MFPEVKVSQPDKMSKHGMRGVPAFWMETKSPEFLMHVLQDMPCTCVVDLTPGSDQLAQACMALGFVCFGMCASKTHLGWLTNCIDRASLRWLCKSGSVLYQEDLATHVGELFGDALHGADQDEEEGNADLSDMSGEELEAVAPS